MQSSRVYLALADGAQGRSPHWQVDVLTEVRSRGGMETVIMLRSTPTSVTLRVDGIAVHVRSLDGHHFTAGWGNAAVQVRGTVTVPAPRFFAGSKEIHVDTVMAEDWPTKWPCAGKDFAAGVGGDRMVDDGRVATCVSEVLVADAVMAYVSIIKSAL